MDVTLLSGDNFSANAWINSNYKNYNKENDNSSSPALFIKNYVSKISVYIQQVEIYLTYMFKVYTVNTQIHLASNLSCFYF